MDQYFAPGELTGHLVEHLVLYRQYFIDHAHVLVNAVVNVDYMDIDSKCSIFKDDTLTCPKTCISLLSLAASQAYKVESRLTTVRLVNIPQTFHSRFKKAAKADRIGQFVNVRGTVVKASPPKPVVQQACFVCMKCGREGMKVWFGRECVFKTPVKCDNLACNSRAFTVDRGHADTKYRLWQRIKLQEIFDIESEASAGDPEDDEEGRVPRHMDVDLWDDLVDKVVAGDRVMASGVMAVDEGVTTQKASASISYSLFLQSNNIVHLGDIQVTRNLAVIDNKIPFPKLVASLCPSIYGHCMVKAGLMLALLGGSRHARTRKRSEIHVLMLGDPGLGKSELLQSVNMVAPRSVFVSATGSSVAGLTATIVQDVQSGEWGVEAGALVIGDGGVCCLDELDKTNDHKCMLEAMEQQTINIAKAGVVCSLPARTAIIAAANPVNGHFNIRKGGLAENVRLDPALLSRFDLLFLMMDKADNQLDRYLSERVLRMQHSASQPNLNFNFDILSADDEVSDLAGRLSCMASDNPVPRELLTEYIAHAREHCNPKMSDEARDFVKNYYLEMRRGLAANRKSTIPITIRHLEAMVRLSEARAKAELRDLVTLDDAKDAVALMKFTTHQIQAVEEAAGGLAGQKSKQKAQGKGGQMKRFLGELQEIMRRTGDECLSEDQLQQLHTTLQLTINFDELLMSLNQGGFLLKRSNGYKVAKGSLAMSM